MNPALAELVRLLAEHAVADYLAAVVGAGCEAEKREETDDDGEEAQE